MVIAYILFALAGIMLVSIPAVYIYRHYKNKKIITLAEEDQIRKNTEAENNKDFLFETCDFLVNFEKEFGITFFDYVNKFSKKYHVYSSPENGVDNLNTLFQNDNGTDFIVLDHKTEVDSMLCDKTNSSYYSPFFYLFLQYYFSKDLTKTNNLIDALKSVKTSDISPYCFKIDDIWYVKEMVVNEERINYNTNKPSTLGLAAHEAVFGTASAMNKVINSQNTTTRITKKYIEIVFKQNAKRGKLYFKADNEKLIPDFLRDLLLTKNEEIVKANPQINIVEQKQSTSTNLDEIKKLKELLDIGAITLEEFNTKKADLLK